MPKKPPPEDFFQQAREKGSNINGITVNGTVVKKRLEPKNEKNYARTLSLWNGYAQSHPGIDLYDLKTLKNSVKDIAYGIDGIYDDSMADDKTVLPY